MKKSKFLFAICSIGVFVWILSIAISFPLLIRPFYYAHIDALDIPAVTAHSKTEVYEAYNHVMDYCTGRSDSFSAGVFSYSPDGASHFSDVRQLFLVNFLIAGASSLLMLLWWLLKPYTSVRPFCPLGRGPLFWGPASLISLLIGFGIYAALNFDGAFVLFHKLLFPGKTNWTFSASLDPIIDALPLPFFRNCAILILFIILILGGIMILLDCRRSHTARNSKQVPTHIAP